MKKCYFFILLAVFMTVGCSSKQLYDSMQYSQRNECGKLPESQYGECIENINKPYEEYAKEREATLDKE